jgi:hypothetical protein
MAVKGNISNNFILKNNTTTKSAPPKPTKISQYPRWVDGQKKYLVPNGGSSGKSG